MLPTAKEILNGLLSRLKIPSFAIGGIVSQVLSWALKTSGSDLPKIVQGFLKESGKGEAGETVVIDLNYLELLKNLTNLNIEKIAGFISNLSTVKPLANIKITAGFNL